ncbi:MAG: hypothetical protein AAB582_01470 [Patescibacteria group bacterium]
MSLQEQSWEKAFQECCAFWRHPGSLDCPFVRLRSGLISDGFFNGGKVQENDPALLMEAAHTLRIRARESGYMNNGTRVVGAAEGATVFSAFLAADARLKSAYAVPVDDTKEEFVFRRADIDNGETLLLAEDTITTGDTINKVETAALRAATVRFAPVVLALCNRSGSDHLGTRPIMSLIRPSFKVWKEGENPYTKDGAEVLPPIEAKGRENWAILTRSYQPA